MNLKAHPDITGYAPKNERWHAYNDDSYDGAEDAGRQLVGYGSTAVEAIIDLLEIMLDEGDITEDQNRALMAQHCSR